MFTKSDLVYLLTVFVLILVPHRTEMGTFVKINQALKVTTHKNFPPYLAHVEVNKKFVADVDPIRAARTFQLSTDDFSSQAHLFNSADVQHLVLDEVRLTKTELTQYQAMKPLLVETQSEYQPNDQAQVEFQKESQSDGSWINELPRMQRLRLEMARQRGDILEPETKAAFSQAGVFKEQSANSLNQGLGAVNAASGQKVAVNDRSQTVPDVGEAAITKSRNSGFQLRGSIEMSGGLAITHEHSIDIRHLQEGVYQERGQINLVDGTYSIHINEASGLVLARLINKDGEVLGEGEFRIAGLQADGDLPVVQGPKLVLAPKKLISGTYFSEYSAGSRKQVPDAEVSFFHNSENIKVDSDQRIHDTRLAQGSQTLMTVDSKNFHASQKIVTSGEDFEMPLLPLKMVASLRQIVSDYRQQDLNNPDGTLIWGQAKIDGKGLSGISVEIESAPEVEPIYFNEFYLPDPSLKATSSNGYYAFLEVQPGFHSLIARRGEKYFAHDNVIVEKATVTLSELKSTMNNKTVQVKSFDAFSGEPKNIRLEMQTSEGPVITQGGIANIALPDVHRLSLIKVPNLENYAAGIYQYDDVKDYVHVPLVSESWLLAVRNLLQLDDVPNQGTVVGFVSDENFEIYTAQDDKQTIKVYFDAHGKVLDGKSGVMGGGFILFNVPPGTNEAIVYGLRTEKFYSQVIPVDPGSLNVLSYRSEY